MENQARIERHFVDWEEDYQEKQRLQEQIEEPVEEEEKVEEEESRHFQLIPLAPMGLW
jgi:hypothetical protein